MSRISASNGAASMNIETPNSMARSKSASPGGMSETKP
jgi:hypothetical protein